MVSEVEIDDLRDGCQPGELGLEVGVVISAGAAVDQDDGRALTHPIAIGHERRPFDVEPQDRAVEIDPHQLRCTALVQSRDRAPR